MLFQLCEYEVALCEVVLCVGTLGTVALPHLLGLLFKELVHLFDSDALLPAVNVVRIIDSSGDS